jgi:type IV secretion system protein VirB10
VGNHYMQRFGAAILLSAANAAVSLGQAVLSKGNGNTTLNLNSGDSTSLAQEILRHQIDIPPTITVPPGTVISIVVDHPIDFSDALRVTTP